MIVMKFVDYLAFVQVSIAFNFAAAYWSKTQEDITLENYSES